MTETKRVATRRAIINQLRSEGFDASVIDKAESKEVWNGLHRESLGLLLIRAFPHKYNRRSGAWFTLKLKKNADYKGVVDRLGYVAAGMKEIEK